MRWTIKPFTFIHQHPHQHHHLMSIALRTKKLLSFFPCARHRMTSLTTQSYLIVLRNLPQSTATTSEIQGPAREIQVSHRPGRQQAPGSLWSGFPFLSTAFDELPLRWGFVGLQRSLRGCPWGHPCREWMEEDRTEGLAKTQCCHDGGRAPDTAVVLQNWPNGTLGPCLCALFWVSGVIYPQRGTSL